MEMELAKVGLGEDERLSFFPAVKIPDSGPFARPGSHGCFISHRRILEDAARDQVSVLILQDDCQFLPAIFDYKPGDSDIFYGGYVAEDWEDLQNSNIIGAHFMGFSAKAATKAASYLSRYLRDPDFECDERAVSEPSYNPKIRPSIDGALVWFRRANPDLRTEFAMLSTQRRSRSDVGTNPWFDRIPILRQAAQALRDVMPTRDGPYRA